MSTASPTSAIQQTRVYRGPERVVLEPSIHLVVDLGSLEEHPTNTLPGFVDGLLDALPGIARHSCSRGHRGGFLERLKEGTWLGHVAEHVALQLQQEAGHDIRRGKTRGTGKHGSVQRHLRLRRRAASAWPPARLAVRLVNHLVQADPEFDFDGEFERFLLSRSAPPSARRRRPSSTRLSRATSPGCGSTSTRWCSSARASTSDASGRP